MLLFWTILRFGVKRVASKSMIACIEVTVEARRQKRNPITMPAVVVPDS
jgi:hypothetical protein